MQKLLVLATLFFLISCGGNKEVTNGSSCSEIGTVQNFTGLDGCNLMIVLENGEKLEPAEVANGITLKEGQKIKLGYKELKDRMSICMAGKIVQVTCVEVLSDSNTTTTKSGKPAKIQCTETLDPFDAEWMSIALKKVQAYQVIRYKYLADGWAYYFKGPSQNMLMDCQGTTLCEASRKEFAKCDAKANTLSDETIIWEIE